MFFRQVRRNAAKNRKGSGLFFGSLVIAIIAFYTLLSLGEQDVMRFLSELESDAVQKLLAMLPQVYLVSLFFVFFLVYFACKYQTDSRKREFAMYLMLGMRRSRLFFTLLCETLWNSLVSLIIGLPAALLLTEGISMATAKIVGLGIIGHQFSFSIQAILWTICGFVAVQLLSMLIICIPLGYAQPAELLRSDAAKKQRKMSRRGSSVSLVAGILLLLAAWYLGIFLLESLEGMVMLLLLLFGCLGTFLFYRGLGGFLAGRLEGKYPRARGLETFTGRQVQENVVSQYKALAIASLLLLMALSCISYGISAGPGRTISAHSADFSIFGSSAQAEDFLHKSGLQDKIKASYPMYLSNSNREFDLENLKSVISSMEGSENIVEYMHMDYVISQSSYNKMQKAMGKEPLKLGKNRAALYTSMHRDEVNFYRVVGQAVKAGAFVGIKGKLYQLEPALYSDNVVADRAISIYMALIVPDPLYKKLAAEPGPYCRNVHLADAFVKEQGLMQATRQVDQKLAAAGLEYDSYLGGIGRNLFYSVAASYLTVYLGILFLLIANTVIGMKYLISQRQNRHRYRTLFLLGADTKRMCRSVKHQIQIFFSLVLGLAAINSIAAILSMLTSLTRLPEDQLGGVLAMAAAALMVFVLAELLYIRIVKRAACREIRTLAVWEQRERSDNL